MSFPKIKIDSLVSWFPGLSLITDGINGVSSAQGRKTSKPGTRIGNALGKIQLIDLTLSRGGLLHSEAGLSIPTEMALVQPWEQFAEAIALHPRPFVFRHGLTRVWHAQLTP